MCDLLIWCHNRVVGMATALGCREGILNKKKSMQVGDMKINVQVNVVPLLPMQGGNRPQAKAPLPPRKEVAHVVDTGSGVGVSLIIVESLIV
jgi:hypothetical protein